MRRRPFRARNIFGRGFQGFVLRTSPLAIDRRASGAERQRHPGITAGAVYETFAGVNVRV